MQIKRLAALSLAAVLTAGMLTGCPWDIEDDASSVTSSSSSSSSRPSYDDEDDDDDTGNTGDTGGEDTETPDDPNKPSATLENNKLIVTGGNGALTTEALKNLLPEGANKATIATLNLSNSGYTSIGNLDDGHPLFIEHNKLVWSNLQSVILPAGLKSIGNAAFQGTSLTSVTLPDSLTSIGGDAFYNCTGLTCIRVGTGIMSATIGENAFADVPDTVIIYYPSEWDEDEESEKEKKLEALKAKLQKAGLNTDDYRYMPDSEMLQAAPAAPAGVKELLDVAGLFRL